MEVQDTITVIRVAIIQWVQHAWYRLHTDDEHDCGDVPGWVVITAIVVGLALAVGYIIVSKVIDKANTIDLQ